jgi:23S rRNA (adenine2503-C2)-methyltransferase
MSQLFQLRRPERAIPKGELPHLRGMSREELETWLKEELDVPRYRGEQVFRWLHQQRARSFDDMSNLSKRHREKLATLASIESVEVDAVFEARDGTKKLRLRTPDGELLESVLIPNDERGYTQCISSQVGCAMDCQFCATASLGLHRNLSAWEIVDQVYLAQDLLEREAAEAGEKWPGRITNLVYMGMGEPLHNFNQVARSLELLMHAEGANISGKRITVSSSGLVPAIERFGREGLGLEVGLAISLNATTNEVRDEVMPINTRWKLEELLEAVRAVPRSRRQRLTFEYVLLADTNDSDDDARRLVRLLAKFDCHVNVIPFNPHPHAPYRRPGEQRIRAFMKILRTSKLPAYLRTPRGDDIGAACGQLALEGEA